MYIRVFIVLLLLSCGCIGSEKDFKPANIAASTCSNPNSDLGKLCLGGESGDPKYCEAITADYTRAQCFSAVAKKIGDVSLCEKTFLKVQDKEYTSVRDNCILSVATKLRDKILCERITLDEYRKRCTGEIDAGISFCEDKVDQKQIDNCYLMTSLKNADEKTCKKIVDDKNRINCIKSIATVKKNREICYHIMDEVEVQKCREMIKDG